jgi:uncharacterized protein with PIN domain
MGEDPITDPRFILDVHLGRLARFLRLLGFDAYWENDLDDYEIIRCSVNDRRIILTRDKGLLANSQAINGYRILSQKPDEQLMEVFIRFDLKGHTQPFSRCMECNGLLDPVNKEEISDFLLPGTREYYSDFKKCSGCGRIYWEGSHYERMRKYIDSVIKGVN